MGWQEYVCGIVLSMATLLFAGCAGEKVQHVDTLLKSLPTQVLDWKATESDATYTRKTLFHYIDGGAELYLTYKFQKAYVRRYAKAGDPKSEITLDIYDMGTPDEAFGIFSAEREDESVGIGQDSEYGGGLLRFWKGQYFVAIVVRGEAEAAKPAMMEMARAAEAAIPITGNKPALLKRLPKVSLVEREVRYFHSVNVLNNHYFIANENILNLGSDTQCILAKYNRDDASIFLLLVQYPAENKAQEAFARFMRTYMPEASTTGYAQMENKKWAMAKIDKNVTAFVFESPSKEKAEQLLSEITSGDR
jgi:hypothetical protein